MTFLNAGLLAAGLAAIAIPILIHLLMRRRRKPVQWGAMRFLMEAYKRTRRRLLIQRWLLLALRCLLLGAIAFSLGRPLLGALAGDRVGGRTLTIVIDNSLTAAATGESGGTALSRHIAAARDALAELGEGDRAGLVLLGAPAERLVAPPTGNLPSIRAILDELAPTDSRADFAAALADLGGTAPDGAADAPARRETSSSEFVLLLSDFAKGSVDLETALPRLPAGTRLITSRPAAAPARANVTIRSAAPLRSSILADQLDQSQTLTVQLLRSGPGAAPAAVSRVSIKAESAGATDAAASAPAPVLGEAVVNWSAGQTEAAVTIAIDSGAAEAVIRRLASLRAGTLILVVSIDNDTLPADNQSRVLVGIGETLRVGLIGAPPGTRRPGAGTGPESLSAETWLRLALRPREDSSIEIIEIDPAAMDQSRLAGLDAVIITAPQRVAESDWSRLRQLVEGRAAGGAGGASGSAGPSLMCVLPPADVAIHSWADAMSTGLGLGWTFAREARVIDLSADAAAAIRVVPGNASADLSLLAPVRSELSDLARSVNIARLLPVTAGAESAATELALSDGTGLVLVTQLGERRKPDAPAPEGATGTSGGAAAGSMGAAAEGRGTFVFVASTFDLRWNDLPVKPLMVPLVQELVRQGSSRASRSSAVIAGQRVIAPAQATMLRSISVSGTPRGDSDSAGAPAVVQLDQWGGTARPIRHAGVWNAEDSSGGSRGLVAINPDPLAGSTSAIEPAAIEAWLSAATPGQPLAWLSGDSPGASGAAQATARGGIREAMTVRTESRPASAILLVLALVLALGELALAKLSSPSQTGV